MANFVTVWKSGRGTRITAYQNLVFFDNNTTRLTSVARRSGANGFCNFQKIVVPWRTRMPFSYCSRFLHILLLLVSLEILDPQGSILYSLPWQLDHLFPSFQFRHNHAP